MIKLTKEAQIQKILIIMLKKMNNKLPTEGFTQFVEKIGWRTNGVFFDKAIIYVNDILDEKNLLGLRFLLSEEVGGIELKYSLTVGEVYTYIKSGWLNDSFKFRVVAMWLVFPLVLQNLSKIRGLVLTKRKVWKGTNKLAVLFTLKKPFITNHTLTIGLNLYHGKWLVSLDGGGESLVRDLVEFGDVIEEKLAKVMV